MPDIFYEVFVIIIYVATNTENGKVYIGQTINTLRYRKNQHKNETYTKNRPRTFFHNAIAKYGIDAFQFAVIDDAQTIEELNAKEQFWIQWFNSTDKHFGYNLDSGGSNCKKSESTKRLISERKKAHWQDEETAVRMRNGLSAATSKWVEVTNQRRIKCACLKCGKEFYLPPNEARVRKYCSLQCANMVNQVKSTECASKAVKERHNDFALEVKTFIEDWCSNNKEYVMMCKLNNVSTHYKPMFEEVTQKFGIKDPRSIIKCVIGSYNRKEFAIKMKRFVSNENICRTGPK